jgi:hypothetical protein
MTVAHYSVSAANNINPYLDIWTPQYRIVQTLLEDIETSALTVDPNDKIGTYSNDQYYETPDLMRGRGWFAGFHDVEFINVYAYDQASPVHPWRKMYVILDGGPVTSSAFEGLRDGFEDFGYWRKFSLLLAEAEVAAPGSQAVIDAQAFKDDVFDTNDPANGLIPMQVVGGAGGGRDWLQIVDHDRWRYLDVREQLFTHIIALKGVLGI